MPRADARPSYDNLVRVIRMESAWLRRVAEQIDGKPVRLRPRLRRRSQTLAAIARRASLS